MREIVEPTLAGARAEGFAFKGVLFLGLMLTADGPKLLEYNVRFGDPETQAILIRLKTDLSSVFEAIRDETLGQIEMDWAAGSSACVVAANRGYPGKYETGAEIEGVDQIDQNSSSGFPCRHIVDAEWQVYCNRRTCSGTNRSSGKPARGAGSLLRLVEEDSLAGNAVPHRYRSRSVPNLSIKLSGLCVSQCSLR